MALLDALKEHHRQVILFGESMAAVFRSSIMGKSAV